MNRMAELVRSRELPPVAVARAARVAAPPLPHQPYIASHETSIPSDPRCSTAPALHHHPYQPFLKPRPRPPTRPDPPSQGQVQQTKTLVRFLQLRRVQDDLKAILLMAVPQYPPLAAFSADSAAANAFDWRANRGECALLDAAAEVYAAAAEGEAKELSLGGSQLFFGWGKKAPLPHEGAVPPPESRGSAPTLPSPSSGLLRPRPADSVVSLLRCVNSFFSGNPPLRPRAELLRVLAGLVRSREFPLRTPKDMARLPTKFPPQPTQSTQVAPAADFPTHTLW